ncbi:MAG: AAA family ATPase [Ignavibacteriaceae bacterium]|nr:AAA family ATPase [Ignavibacteriaceae bacterium]
MTEVTTDVREFKALVESGNLSLNRAARSMGISTAALSTFLNGKYTGNTDTIAKKIQDYMQISKERASIATNEDLFTETTNSRLAYNLCRRIHQNKRIGVLIGRAGLGKTTALMRYADEFSDVIYIEVDSSFSPRELVKALNSRLNNNVIGTINDIKNQLIAKLKDTGRLLIIDQAEYLSEKALDILRTIHDRTRCPIVLAGLPQLFQNLKGVGGVNEQIFTRISMLVELKKLSDDDIRNMVHLHIPGINGEYKYFAKRCAGNARALNLLIENVRIMGGEITEETVNGAASIMVI